MRMGKGMIGSRGVLLALLRALAQIRFSFPSSANFDAQISQLAGQISQTIRLIFLLFPRTTGKFAKNFFAVGVDLAL